MNKRRIIAFAACYMVLVVACLALDVQLGLGWLDRGGEAVDTERVENLAVSVLLAPADQLWSYIGRERFGPVIQWLMIAGNAMLWGMLTEAVFSHFHKKRSTSHR